MQKAGLTTVHAKKSELKKSVPQLGEALLCGLLSRLLQSEPAELHLPPPVCPASCWMRTLVGTSGHPAWPGRWTYKNKNKLKKKSLLERRIGILLQISTDVCYSPIALKNATAPTQKKKKQAKHWMATLWQFTHFGSCGGPDWPTSRISAAKPRALAYSRSPDTALLFRWLIRSPTPASCAARSSFAVSGGREGHRAPAPLKSLSPEGHSGNCGCKSREKHIDIVI